jgi:hypothetical protein
MNALAARARDLEDELHRRVTAGSEFASLARESGLPLEVVVSLAGRGGDRLLAGRRERDRRERSSVELVETFADRVKRFCGPDAVKMTNHPSVATEAPISPAKAGDTPGHSRGLRECAVCLRRFRGGRADRVTCSDHCRDLARRERNDDPTVEASMRMLFSPHDCAECGEPLWARRPDTRYCGPGCAKRAQRARWANREGTA